MNAVQNNNAETKLRISFPDRSIPKASPPKTSLLGLFGRLTWMLYGPILLLLLAFQNALVSGWFTNVDIAYFVVLGLVLMGRILEYRAGNPLTADGEPATRIHLQRYSRITCLAGMIIWVIANIIGNYWLAS